MKHIVLLIVGVFMLALNTYGQTVGYTYKPLASEGCNVKYSVSKQDTTYYNSTLSKTSWKAIQKSYAEAKAWDDWRDSLVRK